MPDERERHFTDAIWKTIQSLNEHDIILLSATAAFAIVCVNTILPLYSIRNMLKFFISTLGVSTTSYFVVQRGFGTLLVAYIVCVLTLLSLIFLLQMWRKTAFPKEATSLPPRVESERS